MTGTRRTPAAVRGTGVLRVIRDDDKFTVPAPSLDGIDLPALIGLSRTLTKFLTGAMDDVYELDGDLIENLVASAERIARDLRRAAA